MILKNQTGTNTFLTQGVWGDAPTVEEWVDLPNQTLCKGFLTHHKYEQENLDFGTVKFLLEWKFEIGTHHKS